MFCLGHIPIVCHMVLIMAHSKSTQHNKQLNSFIILGQERQSTIYKRFISWTYISGFKESASLDWKWKGLTWENDTQVPVNMAMADLLLVNATWQQQRTRAEASPLEFTQTVCLYDNYSDENCDSDKGYFAGLFLV